MTAWLLTWLWQGLALTAVVAAALRWLPRLNAATKHLIWCAALVALWWLGWAGSLYRGLTPVPVRGSDPVAGSTSASLGSSRSSTAPTSRPSGNTAGMSLLL